MLSLSKLWLAYAPFFNPVQDCFNGDFWIVFEKKFGKFGNNQKVIDLASGTGELRNHINPKKYIGIDLNKYYILYARSNFKDTKDLFLIGDITKYDLPKNFDTAFLISAAHHLSDHSLGKLSKRIKKCGVKNLIVIDGNPRGMLSGILSWLDRVLGGGKYFRSEREIAKILSKDLEVETIGRFKARRSFYDYPYVYLTNK